MQQPRHKPNPNHSFEQNESIPLRHLYEVLWRRGDLEFLLWQQQEPVWEALQAIPFGIVEFVVLCGRQFGKCLAKETELLTPNGPKTIDEIKVGDLVYGYNKDGSITPTPVLAIHENGKRIVHDMYSRDRLIVSATEDHHFLSRWTVGKPTDRYYYRRQAELSLKEIIEGRERKIARAFVKIPCGEVNEPHAYAIGAFLGNGCGMDAKRKLYISCETHHVPEKVAKILDVPHVRKEPSNFTWSLSTVEHGSREKPSWSDRIHCHHFDEWIRGKKSRQKLAPWSVIDTWNRESLLQFVAGLIDTDGTIKLAECNTLRIAFCNSNKEMIDTYAKAFYKLWQHKPGINLSRDSEYTAFTINNLINRMALTELDPYLVQPQKKWLPAYDHIKSHNSNDDRIGLRSKGTREVETYDISIGNDTNLYVLANQGLITHNSTIGVLRALSQAIKHRDCCILIMGPDINQTKDIVLPKMRFLTQTAPDGLIVQSRAENRFRIFHDLDKRSTDYSEIVIGGMNKNSSSQRGKTVQEILVEEIADLPEDHFKESMEQDLGPALTHSKGGKIVYLTTLPPVPDHPFITETMVKAELNKAIKIFTIDDNIALTPEQYQACVDRSGGKDTAAFKREYLCIVVRDRNRVVLPDWDQQKNIQAILLPEYLFMHTTIDWGGVRDKTCAILHYYDYLKDEDIFWDERVFEPNTPSSVIVAETKAMEREFLKLKDTHKIESRYIDAPAQLVYVDLIQPPYEFNAAIPNKLDWIAGINVLNNRFKIGKAFIHERCKFLTLSARSAMFNEQKTDLARSTALGHADGIMAMSYALRMRSQEDPYPFGGIRQGQFPLQNHSQTALVQSSHDTTFVPKGFGKFRR